MLELVHRGQSVKPKPFRYRFMVQTRRLKFVPRPLRPVILTKCQTKESLLILVDFLSERRVQCPIDWPKFVDVWLAAQKLNLKPSIVEVLDSFLLENHASTGDQWNTLFKFRHDLFRIWEVGENFVYLMMELNRRHPLKILIRGIEIG